MEEIFHVDGTIDKHLAASATELKAALKDLEDTSQTIRNAQKGENDLQSERANTSHFHESLIMNLYYRVMQTQAYVDETIVTNQSTRRQYGLKANTGQQILENLNPASIPVKEEPDFAHYRTVLAPKLDLRAMAHTDDTTNVWSALAQVARDPARYRSNPGTPAKATKETVRLADQKLS